MPILQNLGKIDNRTLSNSFYGVRRVTLIPKPKVVRKRKARGGGGERGEEEEEEEEEEENRKPIFLMTTDTKILNQLLTNQNYFKI